jgi:hypothetical protein
MESKINIMELKEPKQEFPLVLTRYLYPKIYVKQSLFLSLLEHKYDESLFWAYELYFSGFQSETFEYIFEIYHNIYKSIYPNLQKMLDSNHEEWLKNSDQHWLIGSIVATLSQSSYNLTNFIEEYLHVTCEKNNMKNIKKTMIFKLKEKDIDSFKTRYYTPMHLSLIDNCKYSIRNECNQIFNSNIPNIREKIRDNWLFYVCQNPLWSDILEKYNGNINYDTNKIEFDNEEYQELFYEKWNLEPDEQSLEVQNKIIGSQEDVVQINLKEFCEKYGSPLLIKKMQIKTDKKIDTKDLKNTIKLL